MDTTTDSGGFGELLRAFRKAAGVSQRQLADRVGLSLAAIRDLEQRRTHRPQPRFLDAMVAALHLTGDGEAALRQAAYANRPRPAQPVNPEGQLRVRILGSLSVHRGAQAAPVGRGRRRAVLGRLALSANAAVPVAELIDLFWEAGTPPDPVHTLQTYVSRLRSALQADGPGRAAIISRTPGGYQLNLAEEQLDLADFRRWIGQARVAEPALALDMLETALASWRGAPLADIPELCSSPLVTALADERIAATLWYTDLAVASGQADRCLPLLRQLAAVNLWHEPLHARLIEVLAATNLQADALAAYADIRRRLVDDLGIEPGHDLKEVHRRVLRQEPARSLRTPAAIASSSIDGRRPPAQLPADIHQFSGRVDELRRLDRVLADLPLARAVVITAVSGTAGVGKTALAVHWAHQVRHRFPDGQFYVNLRGFEPSGCAKSPATALAGFLDALGTPAQRIPTDLDAQMTLYRSLMADRRMLIVLDNARDADQVRPLLPGSPGCLVVVTSRNQLTGLVALEGAQPLTLDVLDRGEAHQLLTCRLGSSRVAAEPDAIDEIITWCARLPLALAIAAGNAATQPQFPLSVLAGQLREAHGNLDAFAGGSPAIDIRAVFSWSYQQLSPDAARLFRLLGPHPGPDISVPAAASLAGTTPARVRPVLAELTQATLLTEHISGRYAFHDLLRAYATELTQVHDTDVARRAALHRLLDHYLHTAHAAAMLIVPDRDPIALDPPAATAIPQQIANREQALAWFDVERSSLVAATEQAADNDFHGHTWQLAWALSPYFSRQGHCLQWLATQQAALRAAIHAADCGRQADAHRGLMRAYGRLGQQTHAYHHFQQALTLLAELGDDAGRGRTHLNFAYILDQRGRHREALYHDQQALNLFRAAGNLLGQAEALNSTGWMYGQLGEHQQNLDHIKQAHEMLGRIGALMQQRVTFNSMGRAHHNLGNHQQAITCYHQALRLARQAGDRYTEAETLAQLGDAQHIAGQPDAACDSWQHALAIFDDIGHPAADAIRAKLSTDGEVVLAPGSRP